MALVVLSDRIFGMKRCHRDCVYRSLGGQQLERIGCGFMHKRQGFDYIDFVPETYSVVLVLAGRGSYSAPGQPLQQLEAGWAFERLVGQRHTTTVDDDDWYEVFIDFGPTLAQSLNDLPFFLASRRCWRPGLLPGWTSELSTVKEQLEQGAERQLPALFAQLVQLAHQLFLSDDKPEQEDALLIDRACAALAEPGSDGDCRKLCDDFGVGYERFRKLFVKQVGVPPKRYAIRRRLDHACNLLLENQLNIGQIADYLGYTTPYDFSAQFSRYIGISPSAYRTRHLGEQ